MFKKLLLAFVIIAGMTGQTFAALSLLTHAQVAARKAELEKEVVIKEYLAKSGYVVGATLVGAALYRMGAFDFLFEKVKNGTVAPEQLATIVAALKADVEALKAALPGKSHYLIEFGKAVWWQGATALAGALLIKAPIMNWFATPDYEWIFKNKTNVLRVADDAFFNAGRFARCIMTEPLRADYYKDELKTLMTKMTTDFEYLIAYLEYRVQQMEPEYAKAINMDSMPHFMFTLYNDFLKNCHEALDADNGAAVLAAVKDFRGDLVNCYDHCTMVI